MEDSSEGSPCAGFDPLAEKQQRFMWCPTCQKNMPTTNSPTGERGAACMACGKQLQQIRPAVASVPKKAVPIVPPSMAKQPESSPKVAQTAPPAPLPPAAATAKPKQTPPNPKWNLESEWEVTQQLNALQRKLALLKETGSYAAALNNSRDDEPAPAETRVRAATGKHRPHLRFDQAPASGHESPQPSEDFVVVSPPEAYSWGWRLVAGGLTLTICGGALMVWSWLQERPDLWQLGLPTALVGQGALLYGLVYLFETLKKQSAVRSQLAAHQIPSASIGAESANSYTIHAAHPHSGSREEKASTLRSHFSERLVKRRSGE